MTPLRSLQTQGQAVWLDFLARRFVAEGGLTKLVDEDGLTGVTSNPSIFEKAIADSADYDGSLKKAVESGAVDVKSLYEGLAIEDIQNAADNLRPVFDATKRKDGYVSLEVSPYLANDTQGTIAEAQRLWKSVGRDNVMIKVPATDAGLPAIQQLLSEGININVTLLFSQKMYEKVALAYIDGLESFVAKGGEASKVASVASFFISRIDVAVEKLVKEKQEAKGADADLLKSLDGKVAIANAKLAYQSYKKLFSDERWSKLKAKGAHVQRMLWASTGTKNKAYSDVLYVEELIAPDTVNTMPPETMNAFRDHGKTRASLEENLDAAKKVMADLEKAGISMDEVSAKLVKDGVQLFADAFDKLLGAIARKRLMFLGDKVDGQSAKLPEKLDADVKASLESWRKAGNGRRLWARDASLWTSHDEAKWLDWLDIVEDQQKKLPELTRLASDIKAQKFSHILLLGMGGSSLGTEVFSETFGHQSGWPELLVLDSTDPQQIKTFEKKIDPAKTLFIVSSKSGSTLEPNILKQYFFELAKKALGDDKAGEHFIAITDPGSKMQKVAEGDHFRHIGYGKPGIGGRYSVLSAFGLVPATAMGLDIGKFLETTALMVGACGESVPAADNPGIYLGTIMGVAGKAGRDKVTIVASPGIADIGAWLEQLIAESTGKQGKGLIPIDSEPLGKPELYGDDRLFAYMRLTSSPDAKQDEAIAALERAGHPVVRIAVASREHVGQEFFRWEMATAVAGAILGIDPFDQPDVEASKIKTRELTSAYETSGKMPDQKPIFEEKGIKLFADERNAKELKAGGGGASLTSWLKAHVSRMNANDYAGFLAYVERDPQSRELLKDIRLSVRDGKKVATCVGFGPRFLHSTGQAYKGGPNSGVFLQITADDKADLAVPGQKYTFGVVKAAEAQGDLEVLSERGRRLLRVHLGQDISSGLQTLKTSLREALS